MGNATVLSADEVEAYMNEVFPQQAGVYRVAAVGPMTARLTQSIAHEHLRPGDTVSGPTMFAIADCAFYVAVMAMIGRQAMTATASMTINFMRRPPAADLAAEARILKLGKRLATGDVLMFSDGVSDPVAHASVTYALPSSAKVSRA